MTAYDSLIANIDKTAYTSVWDMDKIIGTIEGTISATAPTPGPPTTASQLTTTGIGESYYYHGIFSTDNGVTWNDFDAMIPDLSTPGSPVFQTVVVTGAVSSTGVFLTEIFNYYDFVHGTGTARTALWKVVLFSKNRQGAIRPLPINNQTLFTTQQRNYQKIAVKDEVPFALTSGAGKSVTMTHNLGFIPKVRAFYQEASPVNRLVTLWAWYSIDTHITSTDLTFTLDANYSTYTGTGQIEYRLYYD